MSNIYASEPPTSGKVILVTNYGNIDVELWTKEAPRACRNFIQLCMENYYENNIFHRIIKGFMIQTGDPTGSGSGGESIWGQDFQDEFHSRLRFNHRGIVAMANKNSPHSNCSQFFITLDKCSWLEKKHTIFGKVVGDTFYNVLSISELPTDKDDRPDKDNPPKILKCQVIINPFPDIFPRRRYLEGKDIKLVKKPVNEAKIKNYENKNLLSFDEDVDGENDQNSRTAKGIKASHELLKNDKKLINKPVINMEQFEDLVTHHKAKEEHIRELKERVKVAANLKPVHPASDESSSSESDYNSESEKKGNDERLKINLTEEEELFTENKKEINNLRKEILRIKRRNDDPEEEKRLNEEIKLYTPLQKYKEKYLQKKKQATGTIDVMEKLNKFKEKLKTSKGDEDVWLSNKLKFHVDSQKAYAINENVTKQNMKSDFDAIEVIDPRQRLNRVSDIQNKEEVINMETLLDVEDIVNKVTKN